MKVYRNNEGHWYMSMPGIKDIYGTEWAILEQVVKKLSVKMVTTNDENELYLLIGTKRSQEEFMRESSIVSGHGAIEASYGDHVEPFGFKQGFTYYLVHGRYTCSDGNEYRVVERISKNRKIHQVDLVHESLLSITDSNEYYDAGDFKKIVEDIIAGNDVSYDESKQPQVEPLKVNKVKPLDIPKSKNKKQTQSPITTDKVDHIVSMDEQPVEAPKPSICSNCVHVVVCMYYESTFNAERKIFNLPEHLGYELKCVYYKSLTNTTNNVFSHLR